GKSRAIEIMATGEAMSCDEAHALGLVNRVVDGDEAAFRRQALDYARTFCPPGRAALAVGRIKRAVQSGWEVPLESGLALERELQQILFQSEDAREGIAAFAERGREKPKFSGR